MLVREASSANYLPSFTSYLVENSILQEPLRVIDVGSRGGFEKQWDSLGEKVSLIGFEPDKKECERLNTERAKTNSRYFPYAVGDVQGKRKFYVCEYPPSSGFYRADEEFVSRFPDYTNLKINHEIEVEVADIDTILKLHDMRVPDFVKLDVEGAELLVLQGAKQSLGSMLGLSIEVYFTRWREKTATFPRIDSYLRPYGFELFDLTLNRLSRKVFAGQLPGPTRHGQVIWGQALYLRDAVGELGSSDHLTRTEWDRERVLKMCSIMEIFGLPDCAVELITIAKRKSIMEREEADEMLRLLGIQMANYGLPRKSTPLGNALSSAANRTPAKVKRPMKSWLVRIRDILDGLIAV